MDKRLSDAKCGEWILSSMREPMSQTNSLWAVAFWIALWVITIAILFWPDMAHAQELTASFYSHESLHKETTASYNPKHLMANMETFSDEKMVAASCDYDLGTKVRVTNKANGKSVEVVVADCTNKRFKGKRIDLSAGAFSKIADLKLGVVAVQVKEII